MVIRALAREVLKLKGRSYGNGDINPYINTYMNILEKDELSAWIRHKEET